MLGVQEAMLCKSIAVCSQTSSYLGGSTTSQPRFNIIFVLALLVAQHCWLVQNKNRLQQVLASWDVNVGGSGSHVM